MLSFGQCSACDGEGSALLLFRAPTLQEAVMVNPTCSGANPSASRNHCSAVHIRPDVSTTNNKRTNQQRVEQQTLP